MIGRLAFTFILGIFWFLYPPKAYAECSKCKAKVEWLRAQREKGESTEVKDWDTNKTTWNKKAQSDQPIKVKKKISEYAQKKAKEEADKKLADTKAKTKSEQQ